MIEQGREGWGEPFRTLFELIPHAIFLIDADSYRIVDANAGASALLGLARSQLLGRTPLELSPEYQSQGKRSFDLFTSAVQRVVAGQVSHCEWYLRGANGEPLLGVTRLGLVPGARTILAVVVDVTAQRRMEIALQEMVEQYRVLFEAAEDGILLMRGDQFVDCNPAALRLFGCQEDELLGTTPWAWSPPTQPDGRSSVEKGLAYIAAAMAGLPQRFEWVHQRKDGSLFDAEVQLKAVDLAGERCLLALVRDISERKRAERTQRGLMELERLVRTLSSEFLRAPAEKLLEAIQAAVQLIGVYTGVDRCYVYLFEDDMRSITCLAEWVFSGVEPAPQLRGFGVEHFRWWRSYLERGEIFYIRSLDDVPEQEASFRQLLSQRGVKTMVNVPIAVGASLRGFLGCVNVREHRDWEPTELSLLRVLGEVLGSALARREYELERERARRQAEAASQAKSQFLANVSHELRTPLNGILGATRLLLDLPLPGEARELAETVYKSAESLLEIVNDLLDLQRIEQGLIRLERVPFNLRVALQDLLELVSPLAEEKGLGLTLWYAADTPEWVVGDPGRVRQVLLNLLGNAVKFTERGEILVEVEAKSRDERTALLRIAVHDTGIGIPPDKIHTLFDVFARVETPLTRKVEGAGLGLAIAKSLVELMGGSIEVASQPGEGSTFAVMCPFELAPPSELPTEATPLTLDGMRVLVGSSHHLRRAALIEACERARMSVQEASTAKELQQRLVAAWNQGTPLEAVIVDRRLADMDAEHFLRWLRQQEPGLAETPVVVIAPRGERGEASIFREAGCDGYLVQPVRDEFLLQALALLRLPKHQRPSSMITVHTLRESQVRPQEVSGREFAGRRILLVEDNLINQRVACRMLERLGCEVRLATTGEEAVEAVRSQAFDLVLMDCQLPGMDGFEATRRIRQMEGPVARVPVIALTAYAMEEDRQRCVQAGMDGYLSKPISFEALKRELSRHLR